MSAATMKTHQSYRTVYNKKVAELAQLKSENSAMQSGTEDEQLKAEMLQKQMNLATGGIRQLKLEMHKLLMGRGRRWNEGQPQRVGEDGQVQILVADPDPNNPDRHNIVVGTILYAFEDGKASEGSSYLGEFEVTEVQEGENNEGGITLTPTMKPSARELDRLRKSEVTWRLYEKMPVDRHELFAGAGETVLEELPEASRPEYERDGTEAQDDDPPHLVVGYKRNGARAAEGDNVDKKVYERQLRHYTSIFHNLKVQQVVDADAIDQLQRDNLLLQEANEKAQKNIAYREQEKMDLQADLARYKQEVQAVERYQTELASRLASLKARVAQAEARNLQLVAELATVQLEELEKINRQNPSPSEPEPALLQTVSP
jgi:hypothetical protein